LSVVTSSTTTSSSSSTSGVVVVVTRLHIPSYSLGELSPFTQTSICIELLDHPFDDELASKGHVGTVIEFLEVVTVPPNESALPIQTARFPRVIPASSITVPMKVVSAPSVVAAEGVHQTSHSDEPLDRLTTELSTVVSAPSILKINVPAPLKVIPAVPIEAAPSTQ